MFTDVLKTLREELLFEQLLTSVDIGECTHSVLIKGECINCQEKVG